MLVWDKPLRGEPYSRHLIPVETGWVEAPRLEVGQADEWKELREKWCRSELGTRIPKGWKSECKDKSPVDYEE